MISYILLLSLFCAAVIGTPSPIVDLDVNSYLHHWIQVYGAPTNVIFQGYGTCATADYELLENGNISVMNTQLNENKQLETINGYAYYKNTSEPGKLTVHLDGVPVDSPYWIVKLGEIVDNQYQYSIVSVPSGISLWVLTRNVEKFKSLYDTEVCEFLDTYHFKYVSINQENCQPYSLSS